MFLNQEISDVNVINNIMDDRSGAKVKEKFMIRTEIPLRRMKLKKKISIRQERRAVKNDMVKIAYSVLVMSRT